MTTEIYRWIYTGIVLAPRIVPATEYLMIITGMIILIAVFVRTYKHLVFTRDKLEFGKMTLRRGSSLMAHPQMILRESYSILHNNSSEANFNEAQYRDNAQDAEEEAV